MDAFAAARSRPLRRVLAIPVVLAIAVVAVACTGAGIASTTPASPPTPTSAPSATPPATPAFPTTLLDDEKTSVVIRAEPNRIVSLTPAATEILFAIGAGDRVAAKVEDIANFPPEAAKLPVVATYKGVDIEKIVGLGSDLVVAGGSGFTPPDAIAKIRGLGIAVLVLDATSIAGALHDIDLVGDAVGASDAARNLSASMQASIDQLAAATRAVPKPRVFYEIGADPQIYTAPADSLYAEMLRLAGSDPITTGSSYEISLEKIVAADPQIILLGDAAYGVTADQVKKRPGWGGITAVKTGAIRSVDDIVITRPGPRLVDGLRDLVAAIHPELVLPALVSPSVSPVTTASPAPS